MTFDELRQGGKPALARALSRVERYRDAPESIALLDAATATPMGHVLGLTGPPGVGKSTLSDSLIRMYRARNLRIAALAVDPSSTRSGGALLGDRARISAPPHDENVFVRSLATRGRLGGLSDLAWPMAMLMRALFDIVIVETVGVGQSETEISGLADTIVFCVQPDAGDAIQFMKAGVMEEPDFALVAKSDLGAPARRAAADLRSALSLYPQRSDGWAPPVMLVSAATGEGVESFVEAMEGRIAADRHSGALAARRAAQTRRRIADGLRDAYGTGGVKACGDTLSTADIARPFAAEQVLRARLGAALARGLE